MTISILTLFPRMFSGPFDESIVKRGKEKHLIDINLIDIRTFATDRYKSVDGHPYGGGHGMILRVDVVERALQSIKSVKSVKQRIILLDPQGTPYTQKKAWELSKLDQLILICGHYEGVDERVRNLVDEEISIGDYVLTGGEIPAIVVVDSVARLIPGILAKEAASFEESFSGDLGLLEQPQYTRPLSHKSMNVPGILLSGDHKKIATWRESQAKAKTKARRPDLLRK